MNLLIVDDEMLEVTVIEKMIDTKALGIEQIFKAYSVNQAITVLEKENVAILLTDIEMPKGSGIRLAEWVKEQDIPLIVIFLTSHAVFDYAKKAVELEVKQYLLKPVRKEELIKTLQDAREGYQKMIQQQSYEQQKSSAGIPNVNPEDLLDEKEGNLDKVQMLFADMEEREEAWKELEREGVFELVGSLQYNIEINAVGVNKGTGLVNLGKMLGIRREEIMACGDGDNDIAMLKEVGFGVAMANAEEKVKAVADYITESNNDEGAAKAIEKFVLKRGGELC